MTGTGYAKSTIGFVAAFILAGYSAIRAATFLDSIPLDTLPEERAFVLGRVDGHLNVFYIARGSLFRRAAGDGTAVGAIEISKAQGARYSLCFREGVLAMSSRNGGVEGPRGRLAVFDSRKGFAVLLDTAVQDYSIKEVYVDDGKVYAALSDSGVGIFDFKKGKPFRVHPAFEEIERIRAVGGIVFTNSYIDSKVRAWRPDGDTLAYLGEYGAWSGSLGMEVQGDSLLVSAYDPDRRYMRLDMVRHEEHSGFDTIKIAFINLPGSEPVWHRGRLYYALADGLYAFAEDLEIPAQDTAVPSVRVLEARHDVSGRFAFSGDTLAMLESVPDGDFVRSFISCYRIGGTSGMRPRFLPLRDKGSRPGNAWLLNGRKRKSGGASSGGAAGKNPRRAARP